MASAATAGSGGTRAIPTNLNGTATFNTTSSGVDLSVMVTGCIAGKSYPIHIHEGMSCESTMAQGAHWGPTRGEGIPDIVCGTGGVGSTMVSRAKTDPMLEWSLGDMRPSDVIGHVIVIHDADEKTLRLACGKVTAK
jgi:Cu/Zn superoxide dismutase